MKTNIPLEWLKDLADKYKKIDMEDYVVVSICDDCADVVKLKDVNNPYYKILYSTKKD